MRKESNNPCPACGENRDSGNFCWKCNGYWGSESVPLEACPTCRRNFDLDGFCFRCKTFGGLQYEEVYRDDQGNEILRRAAAMLPLGHPTSAITCTSGNRTLCLYRLAQDGQRAEPIGEEEKAAMRKFQETGDLKDLVVKTQEVPIKEGLL